jgi:hypothetical protein
VDTHWSTLWKWIDITICCVSWRWCTSYGQQQQKPDRGGHNRVVNDAVDITHYNNNKVWLTKIIIISWTQLSTVFQSLKRKIRLSKILQSLSILSLKKISKAKDFKNLISNLNFQISIKFQIQINSNSNSPALFQKVPKSFKEY